VDIPRERGQASRDDVAVDEEHPEPVVLLLSEAAGDAAVEFDEAVEGLGSAVSCTVGVEVAEELPTPLLQGPTQPRDLGDGAGRERGDDRLGDDMAGGVGALVIGGTDLLGAPVGDLDPTPGSPNHPEWHTHPALRYEEPPIPRVDQPPVARSPRELEQPARLHHGNPVSGQRADGRVPHSPGRFVCDR
jgi:hypothetical protein